MLISQEISTALIWYIADRFVVPNKTCALFWSNARRKRFLEQTGNLGLESKYKNKFFEGQNIDRIHKIIINTYFKFVSLSLAVILVILGQLNFSITWMLHIVKMWVWKV